MPRLMMSRPWLTSSVARARTAKAFSSPMRSKAAMVLNIFPRDARGEHPDLAATIAKNQTDNIFSGPAPVARRARACMFAPHYGHVARARHCRRARFSERILCAGGDGDRLLAAHSPTADGGSRQQGRGTGACARR